MPDRLFVLDTSVLMHDPTAIFRFAEHDIYLPMVVLEELDAAKKGQSEVARNVRQVSRFLDELINTQENIKTGIALPKSDSSEKKVYYFFKPNHHLPIYYRQPYPAINPIIAF